jgi:hypothetical protein
VLVDVFVEVVKNKEKLCRNVCTCIMKLEYKPTFFSQSNVVDIYPRKIIKNVTFIQWKSCSCCMIPSNLLGNSFNGIYAYLSCPSQQAQTWKYDETSHVWMQTMSTQSRAINTLGMVGSCEPASQPKGHLSCHPPPPPLPGQWKLSAQICLSKRGSAGKENISA